MTLLTNSASAPVIIQPAQLAAPLTAPGNVAIVFGRTDPVVASTILVTETPVSGAPRYFDLEYNAALELLRITPYRSTV